MNGKREEKQRLFPLPASPPPPRLPPGRASPARSDRGRGGGTAGAAAEGSSLAGDSAIYKLWRSRIKRAERSPLLLEPRSLAAPLPSDFDFMTPPPPAPTPGRAGRCGGGSRLRPSSFAKGPAADVGAPAPVNERQRQPGDCLATRLQTSSPPVGRGGGRGGVRAAAPA